jgi:hypothetical protein
MKPPPGKKKGFALLLDASGKGGASPGKRPNDLPKPADSGDAEPDGDEDLSDLDDMGSMDDDLPGEDDGDEPLAASGDDGDSTGDAGQIDPEVAGLAARLGFHQPHQQQALIDLIQLVTGPGLGGPSSGSSAPGPSPLPESSY